MKRTLIVTGLCLAGLMAPAAMAAKKPKKSDAGGAGVFAKYDANHDGKLDDGEKAAIKSALSSDAALKVFDVNADGKLDDTEIAAIKPEEMKRKKKKNK